jgi:hypothetical protein
MNKYREKTLLTYKVFLAVHNFNPSKKMKFEEVKPKIEKISTNIIKAEENDLDDLTDIEMQESIMRELIFDYCATNDYEVDGFPFEQFKKIENQEHGYDEDYFTWQHTEYYLDKLTLEKKDILELRSIALQKYYPDCSPEEFKEKIRVHIKMAEAENFSFNLSQEEIEEATKVEEPARPKLP